MTLTISLAAPATFSDARAHLADMIVPAVYTLSKPYRDLTAHIRNISGLAELQSTNTALMKENARLKEWYQTAMRLQAENEALKKMVNLKADDRSHYITTKILMDTGKSFVKTILVEGGHDEGVAKNQAVISSAGLIGRIIDVGDDTARVLLLTDINSRIPVIIENTNQHAIMAGDNLSPPRLIHLPPETKLDAGMRIVTSGFGGIFPKGIPVGSVTMDEAGKPLVIPFEDLTHTSYVKIVQTAQRSVLNKKTQ